MTWIADTVNVAKLITEVRENKERREAFELEGLIRLFVEVQRNRSLIEIARKDSTSESERVALGGQLLFESHQGLLVAAMNLDTQKTEEVSDSQGMLERLFGWEKQVWEIRGVVSHDSPDDELVLEGGANALRFATVRIGMLHAFAKMAESGTGVPESVNMKIRLGKIDDAERHLQEILEEPLAEITGRYEAPHK